MKKLVVCDALRLAVITVNHSPSPVLVKQGGGSVPVGVRDEHTKHKQYAKVLHFFSYLGD